MVCERNNGAYIEYRREASEEFFFKMFGLRALLFPFPVPNELNHPGDFTLKISDTNPGTTLRFRGVSSDLRHTPR
jgi:hypothetical protein